MLTYRYYWRTINFSLKSPKISFLVVRAHFSTFQQNKKTTPVFFDGKSKTGLGFEIGQPQQKCQRRPNLQSMANPAVLLVKLVGEVAGRMVPSIFGCSSTEKYKNKIVSRQSCAPILSCSGGKLLPSDVCMWYISKLYFACSTPAMHWASCATAAGGSHIGWPLHQ